MSILRTLFILAALTLASGVAFGDEWKDESGKYSINAKYVSHDEDFKSVTLLVIKRTEDGRQEKEITVPFKKLGVMSQARVRRIAKLKPIIEVRVAEAEAAEEEEDATEGAPAAGGRGGYEEDGFDGRRPAPRGQQFDQQPDPSTDPERGRQPPPVQPEAADAQRPVRPVRPPLEEEGATAPVDATTEPSRETPVGGDQPVTREQFYGEDRGYSYSPATDGGDAGQAATDVAPSDYVVDVAPDPADFPTERSRDWQPVFAEHGRNPAMFRMIPAQPIAGQPFKLLLIVTTTDNAPRPSVAIRLSDPAGAALHEIADHREGAAWADMTVVGGQYYEPRMDGNVPILDVAQVLSTQQPGETYYHIGLKLPVGPSGIQVRFERPDGDIQALTSTALNFDVAPADGRGVSAELR